MSADWSIRRRQTLAEVGNHAAPSQIPQPTSILKKSGAGRASVAPGGLGPLAPRSSLAPQRFFRNSSAGNIAGDAAAASVSSSQASSQRDSLRNSRQSYAPRNSFKYAPALALLGIDAFSFSGRRSSTYTAGRPSSVGFLSQAPTHILKDPRSIKDKTFVANCQRNILEYLISANYPVPISIKTLQVPTSKDFSTIFKFLYNQLDPNYDFVKKIEDEVFACLKALKYLHLRCIIDNIDILLLIACPSQTSPLLDHSTPGLVFWLC
jgi:kinetochore protein NDC80